VRALGLVELEAAGERFQHAFGDAAEVAALVLGVVVDADAGEHRGLLATQAGNPPRVAENRPQPRRGQRGGRPPRRARQQRRELYAGFFEELTPEQMERQLATSLLGPMNVTRAVLPVMREQRSGHVVTISSSAGFAGFEYGTAYAASKFGVDGWMESLAPEIEPFGIHATVVNPGFFRSPVKTLRQPGTAGLNKVAFRLNRLAPGRYEATVIATAGASTARATAGFNIVR
jgi:NAD(P)-dependent dehydrogenase (short-subunit alcohol dehydrogenase family)